MDALGYRKKIGIVIPSTNTSVQPESDDLRLSGVTNHVARIMVQERKLDSEQAFMDHVAAMKAGIADAITQIVTCEPDHLIMGVALEAFWGGVEQAEKLRKSLETQAGVGVSMGSNATVAALEAFGARRIAILTPHQPRGDEMVRLYFEEAGYEITALKGLKCASPRLIAHTSEQELRDALREIDSDAADAIVQVGTNLAGASVSAEAERWLGKPVLLINAVSYWHALRQTGIADTLRGHGRILEEH